MNQTLILAFIAFCAGMVGAGVGNSGGTLMVAGLLASGVLRDVKTAVGTVLFSILPPVSLGAIIDYWKAGKVKWRMGIVLMIANIIGATIGGYFVMKFDWGLFCYEIYIQSRIRIVLCSIFVAAQHLFLSKSFSCPWRIPKIAILSQ